MNIAIGMTFGRIFIAPLFLIAYLEHDALGISAIVLPYVLLFLLAISELSDAFDGYIARKYDQVTDLGKILDPMADSIVRTSMFLTFTLDPIKLPMILVFIFLYRDSIISTLRTICALKGITLAARTTGKIKAIVQAIAICAILILMIPYSLDLLSSETLCTATTAIASSAAVYTIYSGIEYVAANWHYISKLLRLHSPSMDS